MSDGTTSPATSSVPRPRPGVAALRAYAPDDTPCAVDLSDNTNLWGPPPSATALLRELPSSAMARYPGLDARDLGRVLAQYAGVAPDMIVTGCGSDDVLDASMRAYAEPGERLAYMDPTFSMVPVFARLSGLDVRPIPLTENYDADPGALLAQRAAVTYLCSPNNPTATSLSRETIERVVKEAQGLVIVDEAYAEFSGLSVVDLVARSERLVVTRTLSKAFGLAGLRVGYGIASPAVAREIGKARGPYKVNAVAERVAVRVLRDDAEWVRARAADAVANRERFVTTLRERGLQPLPSAANFVLVPIRNARAVARAMSERGVLVRTFEALRPVSPALRATHGDAIRIGIGPWEQMEAALGALTEALRACA